MSSKNLDKKLGIWGKDKIVGKDNRIHAEDYYCVRHYEKEKLVQAEAFWPCMDPDIKDYPYCKPCINALNLEILMKDLE